MRATEACVKSQKIPLPQPSFLMLERIGTETGPWSIQKSNILARNEGMDKGLVVGLGRIIAVEGRPKIRGMKV